MSRVLPPVSPEAMTWRARAYLTTAAVRHTVVGFYIMIAPGDFTGDSYQVITQVLPMQVWGVVFLVGGFHLAYSAYGGREGHARNALVLSAVSTSLWAVGFFLGFIEGGVVTLIGAILCASITIKDLVVCAQPMRSPFERIVEEYVGTGR